MIEGLPDDQWAIISKLHHCMVDGVSGADLMASLLDPSRDARRPGLDSWTPAPERSDAMLVAESLGQLAATLAEQVRAVRSLVRTPRRAATQLRETLDGLRSLGHQLLPRPALSIQGAIGPHRRWAAAQMGMHSSPTGEIFVTDLRVGVDRLIGETQDAPTDARDGAKGTSPTASSDACGKTKHDAANDPSPPRLDKGASDSPGSRERRSALRARPIAGRGREAFDLDGLLRAPVGVVVLSLHVGWDATSGWYRDPVRRRPCTDHDQGFATPVADSTIRHATFVCAVPCTCRASRGLGGMQICSSG